MRRFGLFLLLLLLAAAPALADEFQLPGLDRDSNAYQQSLTARMPAGGTPKARQQAEQQAQEAARRNDWNAAAAALETRIAAGGASGEQWLALAQAQLRRKPPEARKALEAAWQDFGREDAGAGQIPALLTMAEALRVLGRPAQALTAMEAVVERAPDNTDYADQLAALRKEAGMLVQTVRIEPEADPPRACLAFSVPPARRADFHAQDWVRLDPPVPDAAVTREKDEICISGLPLGASTRVTVLGGMPGEGGLNLKADATQSVALPNLSPQVTFDTRLFLLPRGQAAKVALTTVNISSVALKLARISERAMGPYLRQNRLGGSEIWANSITDEAGSVIWTGHADIPAWKPNKQAHTALPIPDLLLQAGPGLYALIANPDDGSVRSSYETAVQMVLRTDLAPTIWRGTDGLTVQVRRYSDVSPAAGVRLDLIAANNDILAQATTGPDGFARFAAPLLHGEGPLAAVAIHAAGIDGDFTQIALDRAAFDLSDRGVSGAPQPGPLDAFVWPERGIYRPGETVHLMALLRDGAGNEADIPVHVTVKRPNGQVFLDVVPPRGGGASVHVPVALSPSAPVGMWTAEVRADPAQPPIGTAQFRVDAFVPDRMAVDLGPANGPIAPGTPYPLAVAARFLYGAPGAGLNGKASALLTVNPAPFPVLAGYTIGLADEVYAPAKLDLDLPQTDKEGHATLLVPVQRAPDTTRALQAEISVEVDDPSGHASHGDITVPVRPAGNLIGIKPLFADGAVDAGGEAAFDIAAVSPDGTRTPMRAKLRLVRERPDWRLVVHGRLARYEIVTKDEPLETQDVSIPADAPLHVARNLDFGRYRLEITEAGGLAATSLRFRSGWVSSENPDVPDKVDVSADRHRYLPGETARIHVVAPFAGKATVLVLTDRVQSTMLADIPAGGTTFSIPVDPAWGPGAYVTVHVFHAATDGKQPGRAIGLTWVGIDPAARKLDVAMDAPEKTTPRAPQTVSVHTAPGAWVSLAAVDEGILRLTRFAAPDPAPHFLGRRVLGLDIRDDWGHLIAPAEGATAELRQGGDEGGAALPEIPQKTVTLFFPPVQAGADGRAQFTLPVPDFEGQARLMAVSWLGNRIGAANADMTIRDPLVAEPLLPRFLAPGDAARFAVLLQNTELPEGPVSADVSVDGPAQIDGPAHLAATLAPGARATPFTILHATGAGRARILLDVHGPAGFHVQRETAILIRPARAPVTFVSAAELPPGAAAHVAPALSQFIGGTAHATITFGSPVRFDEAAVVKALADYPLSCLEQATSRGFPLALLPDGVTAGPDRAGQLQAAVQLVLDRQRFDGGFGLWSSYDDAEPWLSAYATEFLLRARAAGAAVPEPVMADALKFIADGATREDDAPATLASRAYDLYVLALAGHPKAGAERVLFEQLDQLPTPLARAQLGAALARTNDTARAEAAFNAALDAPAREWWYEDYGTSLRDQVATALLLKESGVLPARLAKLVASLPGGDLNPNTLSTQEMAWTSAAGAVLARSAAPARIALDGHDAAGSPVLTVALTQPVSARNLGDAAVWQTVSVSGVPAEAPPATHSQMRITRRFFTLDGAPLDLDHLRQNTVFVLLLEGHAEDGQDHRAVTIQPLPAGWEIAGRLASGKTEGMEWLGALSDRQSEPASDDRYAAVLALTGEKPAFRVAVRIRAVTPGDYELPGATLADMYRPGLYARQGGNRITVLPVE